ncbi:GAF domain-containing protein [Variovorax sp. J22G21]|uniref:GAF domain-containing protein n=1 Tax=Variovorax fucosicus TaxID=3053517 RepID=UPI002577AB2F|nr:MULTISPECIES: GAF domain-containing protein [unclassified Variovorax]MDM0042380.1 GAF domain-containing protein [Variovorax sp. J22R193]MDM0060985.1 GAF domain-containing protein [Variovorax sp. J22G21]
MTSTFIKAAEVWLPSDDGSLLEFGSGAFGSARRFAAISREMCFGRGEGLPGRAWHEGRPILLREFEGSNFRRISAARDAGLTCAVALPLFVHDSLTSVLVIFCGHEASAASCLELWHRDARITSDMRLVDGAFGPNAEAFESASHETYLPRGVGLPGLAWQRGEAVFLEDLPATPARFLRAQEAADAGLLRGLAIPAGSRLEDSHAVTFLAGATLPLARRIERWVPAAQGEVLRRVYAFSELHGGASLIEATLPLSAPTGSIAKAWLGGAPVINDWPASEPGAPAAAAAAIGSSALLAIPVVWEGEVVEVLALYL